MFPHYSYIFNHIDFILSLSLCQMTLLDKAPLDEKRKFPKVCKIIFWKNLRFCIHLAMWNSTSLLMGLLHLLVSTADWWEFRRDIRHFLLLVSVLYRCTLLASASILSGTIASWHRLSQFRHSNLGSIQISKLWCIVDSRCTRDQASVFNQKEVLAAITFNQTKKIPPNGHKSFFDDPNFSHLRDFFSQYHISSCSPPNLVVCCSGSLPFRLIPQIEVIIVFFKRNILSSVPFIGLDEISQSENI